MDEQGLLIAEVTTEPLAKPTHSGECAYTAPRGLVRQNEKDLKGHPHRPP